MSSTGNRQIALFFIALLLQAAAGEYKIFNGDHVADWAGNKFKFMVFLFDPKECTGSWLGGNKVLTAAHCTCRHPPVKKAMFEKTTRDAPPTEVIKIDHEEHSPHFKICEVKANADIYKGVDVAVAFLKSVPVSKGITPIIIQFTSDPPIGTVVTMAGYGLDENKKLGSLKVGKAQVVACPATYQPFPICLVPMKEHRKQMTMGGDSGSPLLWKQGHTYYGAGIYSGKEESSKRPDHIIMIYASTKCNKKFIEKYL